MTESEGGPAAARGRGVDPVPRPEAPNDDDPYGRFRPLVRALGAALAGGVVVLVVSLMRSPFDATPLPFDRAQWQGSAVAAEHDVPEERGRLWIRHRMLEDLVHRIPLVGRGSGDVEELLGPPDHRDETEWRWFCLRLELPDGNKDFTRELRKLVLRFEAGRVVEVLVDDRRVKP